VIATMSGPFWLIDVRVKPWFLILLPILKLTSRSALSTDFDYLRRSMEEGLDLTRSAAHTS
jgi:hypothetical protein